MISVTVPENDMANAKQAKKEAKAANTKAMEMDSEAEDMMDMMEKMGEMNMMDPQCMLQCKAEIVAKAQEYLADPQLMKELQPLLDKKVKALKGLAGLKQKASDAQLRAMKKGEQSG